MHRFGASAPIKDLQKKFGFTVENVVAAARKAMGKQQSSVAGCQSSESATKIC
jgi:transketolase